MDVNNIIEGLQILEQHRPVSESKYHVRVEHDAMYAGSLEWPVPEEVIYQLQELGWSQDEDADGYRALV